MYSEAHEECPTGAPTEPVLCSIFVSEVKEATEHRLIGSADEEHKGMQENESKCQVLQAGRKNQEQ